MDKIEEFDIEIDISDRTRVYDYGTCKEVLRDQDKSWEPSQFKGLGELEHVEEADENMQLQVMRLMVFWHIH